MSNSLHDKVAVVTGATSGIGLAVAKRFAAEGASVVITGRRPEALEAAVAELGSGAHGVRADASSLEDLDRLFAEVTELHGGIDVLVANAGGGSFAALGEITEQQYDETFDTNVKGVVFTMQGALPLLRPGASVILTGSTTSALGGAAFSVYSATKAAVRNLARSWALDLRGRDIRVNVLSPGPTRTPGLESLVPAAETEALMGTLAADVPLGRVGHPDEIAAAALFLASDASSFVHGIELFADGGQAQV